MRFVAALPFLVWLDVLLLVVNFLLLILLEPCPAEDGDGNACSLSVWHLAQLPLLGACAVQFCALAHRERSGPVAWPWPLSAALAATTLVFNTVLLVRRYSLIAATVPMWAFSWFFWALAVDAGLVVTTLFNTAGQAAAALSGGGGMMAK
jgi:hypothetical protein